MKQDTPPTPLETPATAPLGPARHRILWFCSDGHRALICLAWSLVVPFTARAIIAVVDPPIDQGTPTQVILILLGWNTFAIAYVVLTAVAFSRVDSDEFRKRMAIRARPTDAVGGF